MEPSKILVIDDNPEIREIIHILLEGEGFCVKEAENGISALNQLKLSKFDLIILDIMMPGMNGYQTCLKIREDSNAPILFLSARTKESDKTLGFSSGGDDYLAKPFSYNELIQRAKALIRRYQIYQGKGHLALPPKRLTCRHLEIDEEKGIVSANGVLLELTDTEYALLVLLVKNHGQIFSAQRLYESVWNEPYYYGANNTVMVHIRNLRRKVEKDPKNPELIKNIWGKGYRCD
ncbi:MAG: response regulator transcription factor [Lachnospiraceae bacterium]|jgi:two-component system OmpR family response regulator